MSKITDANKKIEDAVVGSYKKVEDTELNPKWFTIKK